MFAIKQTQVETEGYKLKHGRGLEVNDEIFAAQDGGHKAYAAAGVAITAAGYRSEMP